MASACNFTGGTDRFTAHIPLKAQRASARGSALSLRWARPPPCFFGLNLRRVASASLSYQRRGFVASVWTAEACGDALQSDALAERSDPGGRGMVATAGSPAAPSGLASLVLATGHTTKRQREKTARNRHSWTINPSVGVTPYCRSRRKARLCKDGSRVFPHLGAHVRQEGDENSQSATCV